MKRLEIAKQLRFTDSNGAVFHCSKGSSRISLALCSQAGDELLQQLAHTRQVALTFGFQV